MPDPTDEGRVEEDGLEVQDVLTGIWEATGTLAKRPDDADAVLQLVELVDEMERTALPFGFESAVWKDLVAKAVTVRASLDADEDDEADVTDSLSDEALQDACRALHTQLRQYI